MNKIAKIAGFLYLLLIPLGIFGILYVPSTLIITGDISGTVNNIIAHESLFRLSIMSSFLVQIVNIFLALFLYKLFESIDKDYAILMLIFIFLGAPIALLNELNYFAILESIKNPESGLSQISLYLNLHQTGIYIAQIFWGLWLFPMGYLVFKSKFLPKIIGILLIIGCFGYLLDSFIFFVIPNFGITFSEFTFLGELILPLWLIIKGINIKN